MGLKDDSPLSGKPLNEKTLFSLSSIASLLQVHRLTIRRWVKQGRFPAPDFKVGRSHRWSRSILLERFPSLSVEAQKGGA